MSERDEERLREFHDVESGRSDAQARIEAVRDSIKAAKEKVPPEMIAELDHMHRRLGEMKSRLHDEQPLMKMKQGGAKHALRMQDEERFEARPEDDE